MLSIDKVNDLYDHNSSVTGPDFARAVLKDIGVEYEVLNKDVLKHLPDGAFITISNHPYGHIDGVMLVDLFGHIRPDFKVMVNKFLGRIRFHDLRHTCASLLLANGISMKQIQDWLGHSDFSTTANIYAHLEYDTKLQSAEMMAKVIGYED